MSNHLDALVAPTGFPMVCTHHAECTACLVCMYTWHDGSTKSENVLSSAICLLILTSVMWLAKKALDLSFFVVACHFMLWPVIMTGRS